MDPKILKELQQMEKKQWFWQSKIQRVTFQILLHREHILRKPLEEWPESINRVFQAHQP
jgi:proline iminopeptidase